MIDSPRLLGQRLARGVVERNRRLMDVRPEENASTPAGRSAGPGTSGDGTA